MIQFDWTTTVQNGFLLLKMQPTNLHVFSYACLNLISKLSIAPVSDINQQSLLHS